ncbi:hypothetical protein DFH01_09660 [Falsiroseomonas bella]|uniref:HNH endonuclease n=1 Tax=Falsiroseomonas bella TaxID=2184016 RepID=A0A317FHV7_9PROT|nr:hypothetical protein [Falsiroseomonas bella]PWS37126.1 hypothetical protein DFH01_09660 [Falsiroseomonas bella]
MAATGPLKVASPKHVVRLKNTICPYCIRPLVRQVEPNVDHVIGRRFVPLGSIEGQWNLLVKSCRACNEKKSRHESVVSAVILQPDAFGQHPADMDLVRQEAARKGSARHPKTKRAVRDSRTEQVLHGNLGPSASLSFQIVGPPQVPPDDADGLAHMQVQAIFFLLTLDEQTKNGSALPGVFCTVAEARRADWGNVRLKAFAEYTANWLPRFRGIAANGFFKAVIRRHPELKPIWSWALEWNRSMRIVGFFGEETLVEEAAAALPFPEMSAWRPQPDGRRVRMRFEEELAEAEDTLFSTQGFETDDDPADSTGS